MLPQHVLECGVQMGCVHAGGSSEARCEFISVNATPVQPARYVADGAADILEGTLATTQQAQSDGLRRILFRQATLTRDEVVHALEDRLDRVRSWAVWWGVDQHGALRLHQLIQLVQHGVLVGSPVQRRVVLRCTRGILSG